MRGLKENDEKKKNGFAFRIYRDYQHDTTWLISKCNRNLRKVYPL